MELNEGKHNFELLRVWTNNVLSLHYYDCLHNTLNRHYIMIIRIQPQPRAQAPDDPVIFPNTVIL